jgi:hypothetical protein
MMEDCIDNGSPTEYTTSVANSPAATSVYQAGNDYIRALTDCDRHCNPSRSGTDNGQEEVAFAGGPVQAHVPFIEESPLVHMMPDGTTMDQDASMVTSGSNFTVKCGDPTLNVMPRRLMINLTTSAKSVLRTDWANYLNAELPQWAKGDFWNREVGIPRPAFDKSSRYYRLQLAYSAVSLLNTRVGDESICSRISLVELHKEYLHALENWHSDRSHRSVGRGDATCIIDHILQNTHNTWSDLDNTGKKVLRTQFHDHKRFGKRWATLVDGLGTGLLLLCSPRLEKLV